MASIDQYRKYAADCVRVAHLVHDPADKAMLLQMAKIWLSLAEKTQKKSPPGNNEKKRKIGG